MRAAGALIAATGGRGTRVLTLQLGQGCSIAALRDGRPVETSMGYTPLEDMIMGIRAGDVDADLASGLKALAGSADVRDLLGREAVGERVRVGL